MKHDHVLNIGNLGFNINKSRLFSFSNETPNPISGKDVDPKFVSRRRKIEAMRESFKERDYPSEREL